MKFRKIIICTFIFLLIFVNTYTFSYNEDKLSLYSEAAILMESSTGKIIYSKNDEMVKYPASTTKILTAILVIEKCDLNEKVTASSSAISAIPTGYTNASIKAGEILTVDELLQVFLVLSANEAGYILAEHVSGSIANFANLMNAKVVEIGCKNTHFTNPSGLHDTNHYTTAYDMCLIARYCMQNEIFRNYVSMKSCTIAPTNKSEQRHYKNTNELLSETSQYYTPNAIGIKTGFTTPAGNCLISAYSKDDIELISVVLNAPQNNPDGLSGKFTDTISLFNFGIESYKKMKIVEKSSVVDTIKIKSNGFISNNLSVLAENEIYAIVPTSFDINSLPSNMEVKLKDDITLPISKDDFVGTVTYTIDNTPYTVNLLAGNSIDSFSFNIVNLLKVLVALVLIFMVYRLMYGKRKKKFKK
jgi:D-alanyl-D-alanine carboxypeptidase (penicillin-binding protein 5/6)